MCARVLKRKKKKRASWYWGEMIESVSVTLLAEIASLLWLVERHACLAACQRANGGTTLIPGLSRRLMSFVRKERNDVLNNALHQAGRI